MLPSCHRPALSENALFCTLHQGPFPELSLLEEDGVTRSVPLVLSSESLFLPTSPFSISPPVALALHIYLLICSPPLEGNSHEDRDLLIVFLVVASGLFCACTHQAFTYNILLEKWMTWLYWSKAVRVWPQNTRAWHLYFPSSSLCHTLPETEEGGGRVYIPEDPALLLCLYCVELRDTLILVHAS